MPGRSLHAKLSGRGNPMILLACRASPSRPAAGRRFVKTRKRKAKIAAGIERWRRIELTRERQYAVTALVLPIPGRAKRRRSVGHHAAPVERPHRRPLVARTQRMSRLLNGAIDVVGFE